MNEIDKELVKYIESILKESNGNYKDALDKVIDWCMKNRGWKGIHVSPPLDVMCGTRKVEDPISEVNNVAKDTLMIMLASAQGKLKEVKPDELERM